MSSQRIRCNLVKVLVLSTSIYSATRISATRISPGELSEYQCQKQLQQGKLPLSCSPEITSPGEIQFPLRCHQDQVKLLSDKELHRSLHLSYLEKGCRNLISKEVNRRQYLQEGLPQSQFHRRQPTEYHVPSFWRGN